MATPNRPIIYLPTYSLEARRTYESIPGVMVVVSYEDVYGTAASWAALETALADMPAPGLLLAISKLNSIMFWEHYTDAQVQRALSAELFDPPERERVLRILDNPDCVAFSEEQLLGLAKQAILLGREHGDLDTTAWWPNVLRAALMVSELMTIDHPDGDSVEDFLPLVVRSLFFNRFEASANLLARYADILLYRPYFDKHKTSPNWIDLQGAFRQATGMDPFDFLAAGLTIFGHFGRFRRAVDFERHDYLMGSDALRGLLASDDAEDSFLGLMARTPGEFKAAFEQMPRAPRLAGASQLPFFQTPLIKAGDHFWPISLARLIDALSLGMYWRLHDFYRAQGRKELLKFTSFVGDLFQEYVYDCLAQSYPDSSLLARRLFGEVEYGNPKRRGSDATLVYGDTAIFFEASSGRLRYVEAVVGGSTAAIDEDIDKCIVEKAAQLHRVVADFRRGDLVLGGVEARSVVSIYPVLVLLEHFPLFIVTWDRIAGRLSEEGLLQDTKPLRVISVEELERVQPLLASGHTFKDILEGWATNPAYSHQSLKNYLLYAYPNAPYRAAWMADLYQRLRDSLRGRMRNH